ncbi:hypothetical protein DAPPUDRAFT_273796 [Daphnia pulex]|uniref:Uncharacterized protein n=1 Tax=Daphnia pulex TaxID=6669 RepID=E9I3P9_DAPPU|nr:hypothetical protein DAPPUDRAFT_273796 [Daphnia pulex]|eukprot:EFX61381.1 hypothetical protein DAPPUDRAFT_273796 [Daphnia pulex]
MKQIKKGIGFFTAKLWLLNGGHDTGNNQIEVAVVGCKMFRQFEADGIGK